MNAFQEAFILIDAQQSTVFFNAASEDLLGYSREHLVNKPLPSLIEKSVFDSLIKLSLEQFIKRQKNPHDVNEQQPNRLEINAFKKNGDEVWVAITVTVLGTQAEPFFLLQLCEKSKYKDSGLDSFRVSAIDDLTGLNNRREFQRLLESHINHPLSLAIFDIDQYKQINQQFGYLVGNDMLQSFALLLKSDFAEAICVARLQGDEFGVVYSGGMGSGFYKKCEAFREEVTQLDFIDFDIPLTVSVGVAKYAENSRQLLSKADEALLIAKRNGGNRVYMLLK